LAAAGRLLPFCPEVAGGLPIPRGNANIQGVDGETVTFGVRSTADGFDVLNAKARVMTGAGLDVTDAYVHGAYLGLELAQRHGIKTAILKAYSPACGRHQIYDGTFSRTLKRGAGVFAAILMRNGLTVYSDKDVERDPSLLEF
jgi:uncharacterized protein YbbK (DUF523 family)